MENTTYIFTYGTLMKDRTNHHILDREDVKFIGNAAIKGYALFNVNNAYFPAIAKKDIHKSCIIMGEVYEVPKEMMKRLDAFEGVPYLYERATEIATTLTELGDVEVSVYVSTPKTSIYNRLTRCEKLEHKTSRLRMFDKWNKK
jgi:gamma-glutamylcyclotransferase (GGCT)/AIG2-like uncharacterized protein YtfP